MPVAGEGPPHRPSKASAQSRLAGLGHTAVRVGNLGCDVQEFGSAERQTQKGVGSGGGRAGWSLGDGSVTKKNVNMPSFPLAEARRGVLFPAVQAPARI